MQGEAEIEELRRRQAPLEMSPEEFRRLGHRLVDRVAEHLATVRDRPITRDTTPASLRALLPGGGTGALPERGSDPATLLDETAELLFAHSLFNGHPRFWGYITSSPAPVGALGDLLAAAVNANCGSWTLSPIATVIEEQTVRWIAELVGFPADCGGILVSGGNMANFVCFLAARAAHAGWDVRRGGIASAHARHLRVYGSVETHTWIQKATDMFGLGTEAIRWIPTDTGLRMDAGALRARIVADREAGDVPLLVVGTAGTVGTGAVDPLPDIAAVCREQDVWFHVDGAYGALAAAAPHAPAALAAIADADSVAVDPHKWLYAPLEAGCALVRSRHKLRDAFSYHPPYYRFDLEAEDAPPNYYEHGPQNSRGFRALKVWLALRQVGREGYAHMIGDDIRLAAHLHRLVAAHPELQAVTHGLSITTFRYVPADVDAHDAGTVDYLNALNAEVLRRLQAGGVAFPSNAVVGGAFVLRVCVVNFRTALEDIEALPDLVARVGREVAAEMRSSESGLRTSSSAETIHQRPIASAPAWRARS
jgi:glutamate/tyrosine decarboxylase-like PLP-dependent enzyme